MAQTQSLLHRAQQRRILQQQRLLCLRLVVAVVMGLVVGDVPKDKEPECKGKGKKVKSKGKSVESMYLIYIIYLFPGAPRQVLGAILVDLIYLIYVINLDLQIN